MPGKKQARRRNLPSDIQNAEFDIKTQEDLMATQEDGKSTRFNAPLRRTTRKRYNEG